VLKVVRLRWQIISARATRFNEPKGVCSTKKSRFPCRFLTHNEHQRGAVASPNVRDVGKIGLNEYFEHVGSWGHRRDLLRTGTGQSDDVAPLAVERLERVGDIDQEFAWEAVCRDNCSGQGRKRNCENRCVGLPSYIANRVLRCKPSRSISCTFGTNVGA
jgi:hypothetical protein